MRVCRPIFFMRDASWRRLNSQRHLFSILRTLISSDEPMKNRRGLFSIPDLTKPSDFTRLAAQAMRDCDALRSSLATQPKPSSRLDASRILYQLDGISKTVCNVIDAAELARSVCADEEWRESAHRAFGILADYIAELNSDQTLYQALVQVTSSTTIMNELSEEQRRFATLLKAEFERDAIHLPDDKRNEVRRIQSQVTELEGMFSRNIVQSAERGMFWANAQAVQDVLPTHVLNAYGMTGEENSNGNMQLTGDSQILQSLLKYSADAELRRHIYFQTVQSVPENIDVLQALVKGRHQLAKTMGFNSYAERVLRDKMALTQENVFLFLHNLQANTRQTYAQEMAILAEAKRRVEGSSVLEPWDISYYVGLAKARDGFDINSVSQYFTLANCLDGMRLLVTNLFGIEMREEPMTDSERWEGDATNLSDRVRRYEFVNSTDDSRLGTMYLDLHPRRGKYGHAAHFTVRCGCAVSGPDDDPARYQLPIIALVCNLSGAGADSVLTHGEVETLFHEFGHALHSLLSRTRFQHMSGTRAAMDFVETPSHLIENFVWDPEFLKIVAVHHLSGEAMPDSIIKQLRSSRYDFSSIERQNQIIYAKFDQILHGEHCPTDISNLFSTLHTEHGVPHVERTHWYTRFGHLVTYGAGYYAYLYSQVFAADIWRTCFEGNSLSRDAGENLWHKLLAHGGAREPGAMLQDILGRTATSKTSN